MLAFSIDYYGIFFGATQSVELFCTYFIPESLNKLRQYDIQKNGELVDTLECYLNVNQSLKKTSELMFIHYRTASYRLQKIIEITNIDFNNPAEVLSVRIGLIAIRVLEVM